MAALGVLVVCVGTSCVSTSPVSNYQIEQRALVPSNAAPRATGPLADLSWAHTNFSLVEGGIQLGVVDQAGGQGARLLGHDIPLVQANIRAAMPLYDSIELGFSARYANGGLPASSSLAPREMELENAHTGGVGMQARVRVLGDRRLGLLLGLETSIDVVPVRRDVYTSESDVIEEPGNDWADQYPDRESSETIVDAIGGWAGQVSVLGEPAPWISGELGVRASTQERYFGARNLAEVCESNPLTGRCDVRRPSDVPLSETVVQGTVFGVAMFEVVERTWSVGGKAWWTPWGPQSLARASPGGGEFMVRRHFQ